jgi:hypothetical protein
MAPPLYRSKNLISAGIRGAIGTMPFVAGPARQPDRGRRPGISNRIAAALDGEPRVRRYGAERRVNG